MFFFWSFVKEGIDLFKGDLIFLVWGEVWSFWINFGVEVGVVGEVVVFWEVLIDGFFGGDNFWVVLGFVLGVIVGVGIIVGWEVGVYGCFMVICSVDVVEIVEVVFVDEWLGLFWVVIFFCFWFLILFSCLVFLLFCSRCYEVCKKFKRFKM